MIKLWLKKEKCTGCAACVNACKKNAISMKQDKSGFYYPHISENCIECGLCKKVCEGRLKEEKDKKLSKEVYAAWSKNTIIRNKSTSGGIFSELGKEILRNNGRVVGAQYNSELLVEHVVISDVEELEKIRQSKYVQSNMELIYQEVREILEKDVTLLFCGTPCQVAALYSFLGKDYKKLITVDFICRGVNSPKAYQAWINEIEEIQHKRISSVWFKYKVNGWKKSPKCTRVDFVDDTYKIYYENENLFMEGYLGPNLYIRPCCGKCDFKGENRNSDITLADFWSIDSALDDDKGTSMVLVNSQKGKKIFENIKSEIWWEKRNLENVRNGNVCFDFSVKVPYKSKAFLQSLDDMKFSDAVKKYMCDPWWEKLFQYMFKIINKIFYMK